MGIVLQLLGLVITFTMAMEGLRRLGIDVGWLNPLTFFRRRAWRKKVTTPPIYALQHPVDVVGVMALAVVQTTGAVSVEQKAGVQRLLRDKLDLQESEASDLWLASSHMLRSRALEASEVPAVLEPSAGKFSDYHRETLLAVMRGAAQIEPPLNPRQQALLDAVDQFFARHKKASGPWAAA
jgi:hypothetical protein